MEFQEPAAGAEPLATSPAPQEEIKLPRIRYTIGPETLSLGDLGLVKGEWSGQVSEYLAAQAVLPERVTEYGFEAQGYTPSAAAPDTPKE